MGRKPKEKTGDDALDNSSALAEPDALTIKILLAMLSNSRMYSGLANEDVLVIKTAVRLRKLIADELKG